jgi:hypothetical protein
MQVITKAFHQTLFATDDLALVSKTEDREKILNSQGGGMSLLRDFQFRVIVKKIFRLRRKNCAIH